MNLSDTEKQVIQLLSKEGPLTCSQIGEALWGKHRKRAESYARPAGRIVRRMERRELVMRSWSPGRDRMLIRLGPEGRKQEKTLRGQE